MTIQRFFDTCIILFAAACFSHLHESAEGSWHRHTIDRESRGADGVRLGDVDGDGLLDVATAWEEGGLIRISFNPGSKLCKGPWPAITVGKVDSPEDAVFVDLDRDGVLDVVSCSEGSKRTVHVHWAPKARHRVRDPGSWSTVQVPATAGKQMWMFAEPADVDIRGGPDLFLGSKGADGAVGWLEIPSDPRDVERWKYHKLRPAGWVMSLIKRDMDTDGDDDVIVSDRMGNGRGIFWLENPGPDAVGRGRKWAEHTVGGQRHEVMFADWCDLDQDGKGELLAATREGCMLLLKQESGGGKWQQISIVNPFQVSHGKAVRVADIDLDGVPDIVHTANTEGRGFLPGVTWLKHGQDSSLRLWEPTDVSRDVGIKFDLVELLDLDDDGDLDILTCEERRNLGVIWYENPTR